VPFDSRSPNIPRGADVQIPCFRTSTRGAPSSDSSIRSVFPCSVLKKSTTRTVYSVRGCVGCLGVAHRTYIRCLAHFGSARGIVASSRNAVEAETEAGLDGGLGLVSEPAAGIGGLRQVGGLEPERGLEPLTPSLPWRCSTD
jgi:hypothetical protein